MARIAARQHGLVGRRQLVAIGMSDRGIARRVARGRLHRMHAGVYTVGPPRLTQKERWMAAVIAGGQGARLSHVDAASLWGFYEARAAAVHVTVLHRRRVNGIILHRTRRLDPTDVTERHGIPVTTVARTFVDLTECLSEDRLLRALREAEFGRLLDLDALTAAVERAHG